MRTIILDTSVVSELRHPDRNPGVVAFLSGYADDELALTAPTVMELSYGLALAMSRGERSHQPISDFIDGIVASYRVMPLDGRAANLLGRLLAVPALRNFAVTHPGAKRPRFHADLSISAIAAVNDASVATRNTRDFRMIAQHCPGLEVIDTAA